MRGFGTKALCSSALCVILATGGFSPAYAGVAKERALSMWVRFRGPGATVYIVFAAHQVGPKRPLTFGGVGKIPCKVRKGRTFTNVICNGRLRVGELPADAFFVHPTLDTARVRFKAKGRTHRVRWRAVDDRPDARVAPLPGPNGVTVYAEMKRKVTATGRVLGRRLRPGRGIHFAELSRGGTMKIPPRVGSHRVRVRFRF
ncbi:MAG TPA: hypothetical protein VM784_10155 [Actinomycetota bacterium]|nr:hypothetical protein [Actinomycetota bacterium]